MKNTLVKTTRLPQVIGYRAARHGEVGPQPIWLAQGGSEDDGAGDDTGGDEGDDDKDDDKDDADESTKDDSKKSKTVSREEFDRQAKHLSKADQRRTAAENRAKQLEEELKAIKTKDLPDAERAQAEHQAVVQERDSFKAKFEKLARTNAFLLASESAKITWANSSAARKVGDLEDLEIEEDGTVPGMVEAVKELAKAHPYLLAPKDSTDTKNTTGSKSGSVVGTKNTGKKKDDEQYSPEELRRLFPALNT
jgi:hypothetical protein